MALIKSISGIRGTIGGETGENLTPIDIVKFTIAYSRLLSELYPEKRLTMVIGRDARISGRMVNNLVEGTLLGCGVDVINVGMCTTPGVEVAVKHYGADGGVIITASHNPREWNALKLLNAEGEFINAEQGARLLTLSEQGDFSFPTINSIGKVVKRNKEFNSKHIEKVLALPMVNLLAVQERGFKVVVDAVNSIGGVVIPELLRQMGCQVIEINCEPTGEFAHNPEPLAENLTEISEVIRLYGADLGVVVDPDVDRLALVCEDGEMFGEEYTLVAVADYILGQLHSGNTVSNLSSSRALRDVTLAHGGSYSASAVGEVNVVEMMKATGAVIGGEGNGGVIYPESHYGRDSLVGVALFLTYFATKNIKMSELKASFPQYFASKNKIQLTPEIDVDNILTTIKSRYEEEEINDIDGVKIDFDESWVHLRKSNTEPIIRIYTEAKSQDEADSLAEKFIEELTEISKMSAK
ncbi:MAG: phosphoglucosamine mutase [Rikenellaceae bacterium]